MHVGGRKQVSCIWPHCEIHGMMALRSSGGTRPLTPRPARRRARARRSTAACRGRGSIGRRGLRPRRRRLRGRGRRLPGLRPVAPSAEPCGSSRRGAESAAPRAAWSACGSTRLPSTGGRTSCLQRRRGSGCSSDAPGRPPRPQRWSVWRRLAGATSPVAERSALDAPRSLPGRRCHGSIVCLTTAAPASTW